MFTLFLLRARVVLLFSFFLFSLCESRSFLLFLIAEEVWDGSMFFCFTSFMLLPCFGCRVFLPFFGAFTFLLDWHLAALKESIMTLQNLAKFDTLVLQIFR